jgi:hypothetical protein
MPKKTKTKFPSPYAITKKNGIYQFETVNRLTYNCRFIDLTEAVSPLLFMYDIHIHEFSFYYQNEIGQTQHDERVSATTTSLLHSFFDEDPLTHNVLYYVCDYSDNRQEARSILFNRWYKSQSDVFAKDDIEVNTPENGALYAHLIRKNNFPFEYLLKSEIMDKAEGLFIQKYGS